MIWSSGSVVIDHLSVWIEHACHALHLVSTRNHQHRYIYDDELMSSLLLKKKRWLKISGAACISDSSIDMLLTANSGGSEADRSGRLVCTVVIRVGFVLFWKFLYKLTWKGVRLSRPINIKAKADWGNPNRFTHLSFTFYLQTLTFPISSAILRSSPRRSMAFWVACRPQSNPRSTSSDGVPPELAVLGLRELPACTGQTGRRNRSDRSAQGFCCVDRFDDRCAF